LHAWPESAIVWLKTQAALGKDGIQQIATTLAQDAQGHFGLKHLSNKKKGKIVESVLADGTFEENLLNALKSISAKREPRVPTDQEIVTNSANKVMNSVNYLEHWPQASIDWLKSKVASGSSGMSEIASTLVADAQGHLKLHTLSDKHKKEVVESLLADKDFESVIRANLEKLKI